MTIDLNDLQALVGQTVKVYRGGPESRVGTLLNVKSDYLTLYTEKEGVVYYSLEHIKSVSRHAKEDGQKEDGQKEKEEPDTDDENDYYICADDIHGLLEKLTDCEIQIDRGGPESKKGKLLDVKEDYLVLETKEDVLYYKLHHIKSISEPKDGPGIGREKIDWVVPLVQNTLDEPENHACNFRALLEELKHRWIKINRGGPESIEGLLTEICRDYLVLTIDDEVNHILIFHIRNLSVIVNNNQDGEEDDEKDDENQKDGEDPEEEDGDEQEIERFIQSINQPAEPWLTI